MKEFYSSFAFFGPMQKILIYTPKLSPRIQYIFDFILKDFSGLDFEFTTNVQFFVASNQIKINYSKEKFHQEFFLESDDFMRDSTISDSLQFENLQEIGKCFYAISRYEEYLPFKGDKHGRFVGKDNVYKTPFIDEWIIQFQKEFLLKFPEIQFKPRKFEIVLTCDVDQAWKYKNKGFKRTYGAILRDIAKGDLKEFKRRRNALNSKEKDPFDTFSYFKDRFNSKEVKKVIFFWLMADYGTFDKNNPVHNTQFQAKIKEVSKWAEMGIHPSYASNSNFMKLAIEIQRLREILQKPILNSRQHYILLSFPKTYQNLIREGVKNDYTMAYADETGFRAGTCSSFYWYDLENEESTDLRIHPFCAMDVAMRNYMKLNVEEAKNELKRLKKGIQNVNGTMTVLFHNSNFHDAWSEWKSVMDSLFK